MTFPKRYAEMAARGRVPAGFVVALIFLFLAEPSRATLLLGAGIALPGVLLRTWAAGHLAKNLALSTSGPFAYVRNPLYLGSLIMAAGFAIAGGSLGSALLLAAFFAFFYLPVVDEEERHLRKLFPTYDEYAARVPRFWPSLRSRTESQASFQSALYKQNREYKALAAFLLGLALLAAKLIW